MSVELCCQIAASTTPRKIIEGISEAFRYQLRKAINWRRAIVQRMINNSLSVFLLAIKLSTLLMLARDYAKGISFIRIHQSAACTQNAPWSNVSALTPLRRWKFNSFSFRFQRDSCMCRCDKKRHEDVNDLLESFPVFSRFRLSFLHSSKWRKKRQPTPDRISD